jgi:hypothetical protein
MREPEEVEGSGAPSFAFARVFAAKRPNSMSRVFSGFSRLLHAERKSSQRV